MGSQVIFQSQSMKNLMVLLDRAAQTDVSVLLQGPSGTGKEMLVHHLHAHSRRAGQRIVTINCGSLKEELFHSELFGHEAGAYTGAVRGRRGLVEDAHEGTLFLDEVAELTPAMQARVLRFLQSGEFYRLGSNEVQHVNIRVVATTNRDLEEEVASGWFREDLFFRLSAITLNVPPLSHRPEDIASLVVHFLADASLGGRQVLAIQKDALTILENEQWPGNVRQLRNIIERVKTLTSSDSITVDDLPAELRRPAGTRARFPMPPPTIPLEAIERIHIINCLRHHRGNKARTAAILGITVKTLYNKLERIFPGGLPPDLFTAEDTREMTGEIRI